MGIRSWQYNANMANVVHLRKTRIDKIKAAPIDKLFQVHYSYDYFIAGTI